MVRVVHTQSLYGSGEDKTPEQRWVEWRKQAKRQHISGNAAASEASQDMEIRVELILRFEAGVPVPLSPPIWRELRLSGATNLGILQDKILSPVMGWAGRAIIMGTSTRTTEMARSGLPSRATPST